MKPYYEDAAVTIYHGDCREIALPNRADVGALITDPPYGLNYRSGWASSWSDTTIQGDHSSALRDAILAEYAGTAAAAVFGSWRTTPPVETRTTLVWDKGPASGMGNLAIPWKTSWECIYILGLGWGGFRDEGVLKGYTLPTWESAGRCHPNEKPVDLCVT